MSTIVNMSAVYATILRKYLTSDRHDDLRQQLSSLLSNVAQQTSRDIKTIDYPNDAH